MPFENLRKSRFVNDNILYAEDIHAIIDQMVILNDDHVSKTELETLNTGLKDIEASIDAINTTLITHATIDGVREAISSHKDSADEIYATKTELPVNEEGIVPVEKGGTGVKEVAEANFLVGNGTGAMVEKTPAEVLKLICGVTIDDVNSAINKAIGTAIGGMY